MRKRLNDYLLRYLLMEIFIQSYWKSYYIYSKKKIYIYCMNHLAIYFLKAFFNTTEATLSSWFRFFLD